jgi:hypothetical protein
MELTRKRQGGARNARPSAQSLGNPNCPNPECRSQPCRNTTVRVSGAANEEVDHLIENTHAATRDARNSRRRRIRPDSRNYITDEVKSEDIDEMSRAGIAGFVDLLEVAYHLAQQPGREQSSVSEQRASPVSPTLAPHTSLTESHRLKATIHVVVKRLKRSCL